MISLCSNINFDSCHWLLNPVLTPPRNPLIQTSRKPLSLQRSSFILDLYTPFSLDDTPVPDLLLTPRPLLTLLESWESPEHTRNTWTKYEVGTAHKLKPTSKPLSVQVE